MGFDSPRSSSPDLRRALDDPYVDQLGRSRLETADRLVARPLPPRHRRWREITVITAADGTRDFVEGSRAILTEMLETEAAVVEGTDAAAPYAAERERYRTTGEIGNGISAAVKALMRECETADPADQPRLALRAGRMTDVFAFVWGDDVRPVARQWLGYAESQAARRGDQSLAAQARTELRAARSMDVIGMGG